MSIRADLAVVLTLSLVPALAAAEPASPDRPRMRTEKVWIDPVADVAADARTSHLSKILFVNRCPGGCNLTPGTNDARYNTSSIIGGVSRTIEEFSLGDEVFNQVIACLEDVYSPYGVQITTEDPGESALHHEAILAGSPQDVGRESSVGGIAPASCDAVNNVISFSFANSLGPNVEELCWTVAQESAHSFGLPNHVYDCLDPMTYIPGPCGRKYFRNDEIECADLNDSGQFVPMPCVCGVGRQNSHRVLLENFGEGTPPAPPTVNIFYPSDGATGQQDNFSFGFSATDPRLIDRADVYINGTKYLSYPGKDYQNRDQAYSGEIPDHPDGYIDIEVRAYNDLEVEGVHKVTVLKGEPCTSADQCFPHMSCEEGRCVYPPPSGELGDDCEYNQVCLSGLCGQREGDSEGICSQTCTFGVSGGCPPGLECVEEGFCWDPSSEGGCCTVAGGQTRDERFPLAVLSLFAGAILLLRRRPRTRR